MKDVTYIKKAHKQTVSFKTQEEADLAQSIINRLRELEKENTNRDDLTLPIVAIIFSAIAFIGLIFCMLRIL